MDPDFAWGLILDAISSNSPSNAYQPASLLRDWLARGGFPPKTIRSWELNDEWNSFIALAVCERIIDTQTP